MNREKMDILRDIASDINECKCILREIADSSSGLANSGGSGGSGGFTSAQPIVKITTALSAHTCGCDPAVGWLCEHHLGFVLISERELKGIKNFDNTVAVRLELIKALVEIVRGVYTRV